ncbi:probable glutathione S-transferase [Diospyros lotus]|uniref:probable glutathione S-transferase n=1 Tax=Diospyros lotus TaxID=55363 RepID=UPI00225240BD|nr:probable glutathione S-transferase [Diospyros lotus]
MAEEMKLLGAWFSPVVYRVIWVLKLKGIEYEYVEEDLGNKSPLLLQSNPVHKKVPVLIHNGNAISESVIIVRYLDEIFTNYPILPQDPYQRAMAAFWAMFVDEKITPFIGKLLFGSEEEQAAGARGAEEAFQTLDGELKKKGGGFFGGESIGLADITLGYVSIWLDVIEEVGSIKVFDSLKYTWLANWMRDFTDLPVVRDNQPNKDELTAHLRRLRQIGRAAAFKN